MENRRMIWAEDETLTGWCCSHCTWSFAAPLLESTVVAIKFNRFAQEFLSNTIVHRISVPIPQLFASAPVFGIDA
jgi:hypothetical protein